MCQNKELQFECRECGANELGYQKYAKCISPVFLQENGNMEYGRSSIDEDDYLCADNGFVCLNCKSLVKHCGYRVETEKELFDYLTMNPVVRKKEQQEYEELLSAQIDAQEQKDKELECY